jgi:hypothetical protein
VTHHEDLITWPRGSRGVMRKGSRMGRQIADSEYREIPPLVGRKYDALPDRPEEYVAPSIAERPACHDSAHIERRLREFGIEEDGIGESAARFAKRLFDYVIISGLLTWAQKSMQHQGPHRPGSALSLGTEAPGR